MNYLEFRDYIRIVKKNPTFELTSIEQDFFNEYLSLYTSQLKKLGLFYFGTQTIRRRYDILFCQLDYLSTPIWQETGLKVEKWNIKSNTYQLLTLNNDYIYDYAYIDDKQYVRGIDFACLSCNCECEKIVITGNYGIEIDLSIFYPLYLALYSSIGTAVPSGSCKDNIKSEKTGNYSVTYYDKTQTTKTNSTYNPQMIYSYPEIWDIIQYYKQFFITL
jgi:hypothetical protein